MFDGLNIDQKKHLADVIMFTLENDVINKDMIQTAFTLDEHTAQEDMMAMLNMRLAIPQRTLSGDLVYIVIQEFQNLPETVYRFLTGDDICVSEEQIQKALKGLPMDQKTPTSTMLADGLHQWIKVSDQMPKPGEEVVIRMQRPDTVVDEGKKFVQYLEGNCFATWNGKEWIVVPPYEKYDFSPLKDRDRLREGAEVTHWAPPLAEDELQAWKDRLNPMHKYDHLELKVDADHEKMVYSSLMVAAFAIRNMIDTVIDPADERTMNSATEAIGVIYDLQHYLDRGVNDVLTTGGNKHGDLQAL